MSTPNLNISKYYTVNKIRKQKDYIKKWEWFPCIYDFKQIKNDVESVWNLSPYVMLSSGNRNVRFYF